MLTGQGYWPQGNIGSGSGESREQLLLFLSNEAAVALLVDMYFDKIYWFLLVFY
jgi:hypothetical protein